VLASDLYSEGLNTKSLNKDGTTDAIIKSPRVPNVPVP